MPGNPNECRMHAKECLRLAESASKEDVRTSFNNLAQTWLRLAAEYERDHALLQTWGPDAGLASEPERQAC